jgi:hypothetical protein
VEPHQRPSKGSDFIVSPDGVVQLKSNHFKIKKSPRFLVYFLRENQMRIISFRPASELERTAYRDWLENDFDAAR